MKNPRRRSKRVAPRSRAGIMKQQQVQKPKLALTQIDYERVKVVSSVVRLQDVLLAHSHWNSEMKAPRLDVEPSSMMFSLVLTDATWEFAPTTKLLEIQLGYRLTAIAKIDEKKNVPLFQLECDWDVVFGVPDEFSPSSPEVMADFAFANGQLNAFPYVRQYVQDVTGRAGWPPLVLPTFRIPAKRPKQLGGKRKPRADKHD
jgi:hypothetical protein